MRLENRVAIVTGGGGGLGEGICRCFAREGASLAVSDVDEALAEKVAATLRDNGAQAIALRTDVRSYSDCQAMVDGTLEAFGRLDVLVCAAGVFGRRFREDPDQPAGIENLPEEDWDLTIDVNLKGVYLCNRSVLAHFRAQGAGRIINVSSVAGREGVPHLAHYAASKAGVISLSQSIAKYMAPYHVNVNTICPGIIWTPMWAQGARVLAQDFGMTDTETFDMLVQNAIAFKRVQLPEDIGNAAAFLASDEAREITGQALNVCGGMCFD